MLDTEADSGYLIAALSVEKLFGLYTYRLPQEQSFSNAAILYGDNGVGKSTILRLAFHLLSAAGDRGHRTALYKAEFSSLEVDLAVGVTLSAKRNDPEDQRLLNLTISKGGEVLALWPYKPRSEREAGEEFLVEFNSEGEPVLTAVKKSTKSRALPGVPYGEKAYLEILKEYAPAVFILNADRRLDCDSVADPSDEVELRRLMRLDEPKRISDLVVRSRSIALSQALASAARWLQSKAVQGANQGSTNVHSVYVNVLTHLTTPNPSQVKPVTAGDITNLASRLASIEAKTSDLARYELASPLNTSDFAKALRTRQTKRDIAVGLIRPYIESLEGRLKALEPIYVLVDRFVATLNSFLNDKSITFRLSRGFSIENRLKAKLEAAHLSSGEQQLLLLFCYVLTARDQPSVFMIDEPEISLNIKWQRQLVQSLLDITKGAKIQFIFASHSMELLAQHRSRVVKLVNLP